MIPHEDAYWTPPHATFPLLAREFFPGRVWEPACGAGWLADVLRLGGYDVYCSDLLDYGYHALDAVQDFLTADLPPGVKSIVANPPYSGKQVRKWLRRMCCQWREVEKVAVLLPVQGGMHDVLDRSLVGDMGLTTMLIPRRATKFVQASTGEAKQNRWEVAWFVLARGHRGDARLSRV